MLYNIYTNDQLLNSNCRSFIYTDDLALVSQAKTFKEVEGHLSIALENLAMYYKRNCLKPNPSKTEVCTFHLKNKEANRHLNITWCGSSLQYNFTSRYLGVTLDRSPTFKQHCANAKMKVSSRNNLLNKRTGGLTRPLCARLLLLSATRLQNMLALSDTKKKILFGKALR